MPARINIHVSESARSRQARRYADDAFNRGLLIFSPDPQGNGLEQLKTVEAEKAREILNALKQQLRATNGTTKSGYLKLMHTRQIGENRMVLERKSRLQSWFARGRRMARTGEVIVDLLKKSGCASPQQIRNIETYLARRGMAGTRTIAELLNRIDLTADPYASIGREALEKRGKIISDAWQAAGLPPSEDLNRVIEQSVKSAPLSMDVGYQLSNVLATTHPTPTARQAGIVFKALIDCDDPLNPTLSQTSLGACLSVHHEVLQKASASAGGANAAQADPAALLTVEQKASLLAELLLYTTRGREHNLPGLLRACSNLDPAASVTATARLLRQSIEARQPALANASTLIAALEAVERTDIKLNPQGLAQNPAQIDSALTEAVSAHRNHQGPIQVAIAEDDPGADPQARAQSAEDNGRSISHFLAQASARGIAVSGRFVPLMLRPPPPGGSYRIANAAIAIGPEQPANGAANEISLRNSSIEGSLVAIPQQEHLRLDLTQSQLNGSTLSILVDPSGLTIEGIESASLEGCSILLRFDKLYEALRHRSSRTQSRILQTLFIGSNQSPPSVNIGHVIAALPDRYAGLKVSLLRQVLVDALDGRPDIALRFAAAVLRTQPRLLENPGVAQAMSTILSGVTQTVLRGSDRPWERLLRYENLCAGVPALANMLKQDPGFIEAQLRKAEFDPVACRQGLEPVLRALGDLSEADRLRWMSGNLGVAHVLLYREPGAAHPDWDPTGSLRRTLVNTLVSVPVVARGLDYKIAVFDYESLAEDPDARRQQRVDAYEGGGPMPIGRSTNHFAIISPEVMAELIAGRPIEGFFAQQGHMLTIDQGAQAVEQIEATHQRSFDRFKDAGLDTVVGEAARQQGQHILSDVPTGLPADLQAKLAARHSQGQLGQALDQDEVKAIGEFTEGIRAPGNPVPLEYSPGWGSPTLSTEHLKQLRDHMVATGIPDEGANFSGYLMLLASVYARLSSAAGFGTEDDSVMPLRGYSYALLNHAKLEGEAFSGADRRIPPAGIIDATAKLLRSDQCANIISADIMLPAAQFSAPEIFAFLVPSGWRHLGMRETNRLRELRATTAANPAAAV